MTQEKATGPRGGRADKGDPHRRGDLVRVLMTGEETGGSYSLLETVVRLGQEPPLHVHAREDELIYVLKGEVTFYKGGNRLDCGAGDYVFLPKGCEHTYCVESGDARLLVLLTPAGLEGYYQEIGRQVDAERYVERLITVSARYGVEITGPGPPDDSWQVGHGPLVCCMQWECDPLRVR